MRRPAQIKPWLSEEELLAWLRDSPDRASYQRRLAIWLTWTKSLHAEEVAAMLGVAFGNFFWPLSEVYFGPT